MEYNGWRNKATWNVALWINNDYNLYKLAMEFMKGYKGSRPYYAFIKYYGMEEERTPDGFKYGGQKLDYKELNGMMNELRGV